MQELVIGCVAKFVNDDDLLVDFNKGDLGIVNNLIEIDGIQYAFFLPKGGDGRTTVIDASRLEFYADETSVDWNEYLGVNDEQ